MLRITVSRIRIFFAVLGCAILSASLFDWAQNLRATESGYAWVKAASPSAPAVETAEIWQVSASCVRPFFVKAVLQSKVNLSNHYALAPEAVRAWRTRPAGESVAVATGQSAGLYRLVNGEQAGRGQNSVQMERGAMLHVRYAEWYANLFKLEIAEHEWGRRLANVADQSVTVSEATRRSFGAYTDRGIERVSGQGDFDHYLLVLLGLGGFSDDQEQALRADCVKFIPVKRIFKNANYLGEIWRWPVDHAAAFSFGSELVLLGIFFFPIDLWLATGDLNVVRRHIGAEISRFMAKVVAKVRCFPRSKFALALLRIVRAVLTGTRAILTARTFPGPAVGEIPWVSKLAAIRLPRYAPDVPALIAYKKIIDNGMEWSKRAMTAITMPEMR
jgi:hypothetical protein